MAGIELGRFSAPTRSTDMESKGRADILSFSGSEVTQLRLEPGWSWSEHQQPIVGTDSCEQEHIGVCMTGTLHFLMDDGEEADVTAGEVFSIAPGHEAWVVGREPFTAILFNARSDVETARKSPGAATSPPPIH